MKKTVLQKIMIPITIMWVIILIIIVIIPTIMQ
jgi:hypothetical protein